MITAALGHIDMSLMSSIAFRWRHHIIEGFQENDCMESSSLTVAQPAHQPVARPDNFVEICDVIALCRPGPLHSGAAGDYIETKWGRKKREVIHPALDQRITDATHGQIVYQEQILRVVTEIGNFDWTQRQRHSADHVEEGGQR
jgi:hypothetical protein